MVNSNKIKGRMVELGYRQKDIAKALQISSPAVSQKLNNVRPTNLDEAKLLAEILKIDNEEFGKYFFA